MRGEDWLPEAGGRTWQQALKTLRDAHGTGLTRWLTRTYGVVPRTAQRWQAGAGLTGATERRSPGRHIPAIILAAAVTKLTRSRDAWVGIVSVVYAQTGRPEGNRNIGLVTGINLRDVAALLAAGDVGPAADLFGQIVLDAYGDLGGTLRIDDYHDLPRLR